LTYSDYSHYSGSAQAWFAETATRAGWISRQQDAVIEYLREEKGYFFTVEVWLREER